jgi:cobalt-zinc-cadmium efflux system outer membrane protein
MRYAVTSRISACVLSLLFSSSISAESLLLVDEHSISLNQAIAKTIEQNPELISFGYQIQVEQGLLKQAGMFSNPDLNVEIEDILGSGDFDGIDSAQTTISIGWALEQGVRKHKVDVARANVSLISNESEIMRVDKAAETAELYLACLTNQTRIINSRQAVELAKEIINAVQVRVTASKAPHAELARAKANLALKQLDLGDVEHDLMTSYRYLSAQWGEVVPQFKQVIGDIFQLPEIDSFEALKERLNQNSEYTRLLSQRRLNETELLLAKELSKPQWRVSAGVRRFESEDDQALVLGFTLPLTLRNRNQGQIAASNARLSKIDADTKAVNVKANAQLFALYTELQHSIHRATALNNVVIPSITQAVNDSHKAYERGRYSYLEWQVVQSELLDANKELIEATSNAHLFVIEIERLTGEKIATLSKTLREKL